MFRLRAGGGGGGGGGVGRGFQGLIDLTLSNNTTQIEAVIHICCCSQH